MGAATLAALLAALALHCSSTENDGGPDAAPDVASLDGGPDGAPVDSSTPDAPPDSALDAGPDVSIDAGTACTSDPKCAGGAGGCFVLVPGSTTLGTTDFCIAQFEMKSQDGGAVSAAADPPWTGLSRAQAAQQCQALGAGYDLPTNVQWQTLARDIESVASNWSGGAVGNGSLNRGHSDATPNTALSVNDTADPCDQTGNPSCTSGASSDFSQKRTHSLSTGSTVWDVAGNVSEWVGDDVTPPEVLIDYTGNAAAPTQAVFGPAGTYAVGARPNLSSSYPSNGMVHAGALAVIDGQNFSSGTLWVQAGGTLLVRGTNFSGSVQLEPNASFINLGSNILGGGPRVASANTFVDGTLTPTSTTDISAASCGGTCPNGTQQFTEDGGRGLGFTIVYGTTFPNESIARGGDLGYGPMAGVFTAVAYPNAKYNGFRCVKPTN